MAASSTSCIPSVKSLVNRAEPAKKCTKDTVLEVFVVRLTETGMICSLV
jgi:hypothetical protein